MPTVPPGGHDEHEVALGMLHHVVDDEPGRRGTVFYSTMTGLFF